jgi:site-specific recombinase XerD
MGSAKEIPELVRMMFGEQAYAMQATAGERLLRWAEAFEAWLAEREANFGRSTRSMAQVGWREFLTYLGKPPWEVKERDVLAWEHQLEGQQLRPSTINQRITALSKFYDFCAERGVDRAWSERTGFNPAKRVPRRKERKYDNIHYLSREEAHALLAAVDREETALGKRDYALLLGVLEAGMRVGNLRCLQWGAIQVDEENGPAWVQRAIEGQEDEAAAMPRALPAAMLPAAMLPAALLPGQVWEAMKDYLQASGRWGKMGADSFVFAPLASPLEEAPSGKAEDWADDRPMTAALAKFVLKRYARAAGLKPELVTWTSLRHTAAMLRVEAGDEAETISRFLGREDVQKTRAYIERLIEHEKKPSWDEERQEETIQRGPNRAQPGNQQALKHGFYAKAKLEGGKAGLESEIGYFRQIMARVIEMLEEPMEQAEFMRLVDVYGMAITRLSNLMKTQKKLAEGNQLEDEIREALKEVAVELGL